MTLTDHLPAWLTDRLPDDAAMGSLHRNRPALYWLTLAVGGSAFAGVLLALAYTLALFPLVAGRAIEAALSTGAYAPLYAMAWFGLMAGISAFFVGVVVLVGRWVGEFLEPGEE